jgi:ATP-dependent Clp protease ATP-binding subunit ClpB
MVRIDMSEYMEKHSVARMIGAPPGYVGYDEGGQLTEAVRRRPYSVGYDEGGQLTEAVRRRPYSVLLFDEIDKAHPDVFNVLLQLLDEGRLTDGKGRSVDFRNTVVIMTSNIASKVIQDLPESERDRMTTLVEGELKQHFRPEFLNRIDEILIFHRLSEEDVEKIVHIQLAKLNQLLVEQGLQIEATEDAAKLLAHKGFDPDFGARPLKRTIQRLVQDPLARMVLSGEVGPGTLITLDEDGGELVLRVSSTGEDTNV